ncbi:hypothetical protein [Lacticaseibacillus sharpeae]|uniref:hypothetical protein n=1 Tax=Lacticaseibacillus sharpeae TaxID=1626 RepID=UPI000704EEAB|nr:hypothetical protein [Lacticaseibacillus sharpeae]
MLRIRHSQNVKRATFAPNYGNPWTPELDRQLMVLNQTEPDKVIAERLGRTINSIWARRSKIRDQWEEANNARV